MPNEKNVCWLQNHPSGSHEQLKFKLFGENKDKVPWVFLWHWGGNGVDGHHAHVRGSSCTH